MHNRQAFHADTSTSCSNRSPRYKSLFLSLAAWEMLIKCPRSLWSRRVGLVTSTFTQSVVLQVASSTESTFSEVFLSAETDQCCRSGSRLLAVLVKSKSKETKISLESSRTLSASVVFILQHLKSQAACSVPLLS